MKMMVVTTTHTPGLEDAREENRRIAMYLEYDMTTATNCTSRLTTALLLCGVDGWARAAAAGARCGMHGHGWRERRSGGGQVCEEY
jgi:hypothetical protein